MRIDVVTLFPELVESCTRVGVIGRAQDRGLLQVQTWNPRTYATDNYQTVDGRPYGGGPGMVMLIDPLRDAIAAARAAEAAAATVIYMSPQGTRLTQDKVAGLARRSRLILLCGRYEGVDERLLENEVDEELSIGDYVLSGGEMAAAVVIDAIGRLQEGALNDAQSAAQDSFSNGLLDCPHYTRPEQHAMGAVPPVLLCGDHAAIARWRLQQSLGRTWLRRPELLARMELTHAERELLKEFRDSYFVAKNKKID